MNDPAPGPGNEIRFIQGNGAMTGTVTSVALTDNGYQYQYRVVVTLDGCELTYHITDRDILLDGRQLPLGIGEPPQCQSHQNLFTSKT